MANKVALIAGVGGMCGSNMARLLAASRGWDIIGLSRTAPDLGREARHVPVDLLDAQATRERLAALGHVTHIFYTALIGGRTLEEENELNRRLLVNLIDAVVPIATGLEHIHLLEGVKWYGYHLGAYKTPAREDDPPCTPRYFYQDQHDYVLKAQQGRSWTWSTSRPGAVCGYAPAANINLMTVLAVYATILKTLDMPLYFPGDQPTYDALTFTTDVGLLNRSMLWMSTHPGAANQAFNIGNGDAFRWRDMWPRIAAMFDMDAGPVRAMQLTSFMADKNAVWEQLTERHGLKRNDLRRLAPWGYADTVFRRRWDNLISTVKANRFGFTEMMDSEQMMRRIFQDFRAQRVIP